MPSFRDLVFQLLLLLVGTALQLAIPAYLDSERQKQAIKAIGVVVMCVALLWIGFIWGETATQSSLEAKPSITSSSSETQPSLASSATLDSPVGPQVSLAGVNNVGDLAQVKQEDASGNVIGSVQGEGNIVVQGESNAISVGAKLPELTDENLGSIIEDAVPQYDRMLASVISRPPGQKPLLFLAFELDHELYVRVIKNVSEKWVSIWELVREDPAFVTTGMSVDFLDSDRYIWMDGCLPHFCGIAWLQILYDTRENKGWVIKSNSSGKKGEEVITVPKGWPDDMHSLYVLQQLIFERHGLSDTLDAVVATLPVRRRIPPLPEYAVSKQRILAKINDPSMNDIYNSFKLDSDGDGQVEQIVIANNGDLNESARIYALDTQGAQLIYSAGELTGFWDEVGLFPSVDGAPYLVLGTHMGANGAVADVKLFRWNGAEYEGIQGDHATAVRRDLDIAGWPYDY